jgi:hypothetical protein
MIFTTNVRVARARTCSSRVMFITYRRGVTSGHGREVTAQESRTGRCNLAMHVLHEKHEALGAGGVLR